MNEYTLRRLLGGIANGRDAPADWQNIAEWQEPGAEGTCVYEKREFFHGGDKFYVWVAAGVTQDEFLSVMFWHREMYRGDLVAAQKEILRESVSSAMNYTNVILVVGYAALIALLSQGKDVFTPLTYFCATIFTAISVVAFILWEIFGMVVRSMININMAKAVKDEFTYIEKVRAHQEQVATLMRYFQPSWIATVGIAAGFGIAAFVIILSGYVHAAWLAL